MSLTSRNRRSLRSRWSVTRSVLLALPATGILLSGCTSRPVVSNPPELQTNILQVQVNTQIDKVDLLFDIDNSSSMGDKQQFLSEAIPDLIGRLIQPNCISTNGTPYQSAASSSSAPSCNAGDALEFPAVHDLHVGIVSSSLGQRGGGMCNVAASGETARVDDQGHLLGNNLTGWTTVTQLTSSNFLAWFPGWPSNTGVASPDPSVLTNPSGDAGLPSVFADMVVDVGVDGCGIESQLESWYRFLIQPDPYQSIDVDAGTAAWSDGVDSTILQQRAAFLRPDSLVSIIVLTDENDSEIDARANAGSAYQFMDFNPIDDAGQYEYPGGGQDFQPCKAPPICATNPNDPSCVYGANAQGCATGAYSDPTDWGYDGNLRHVHMKEKYGIDPQYPISRYVNGLTSLTVPDRTGEYPAGAGSYQGANNCRNPLFTATLYNPSATATLSSSQNHAELCNASAAVGSRTPDMVFYAIIGGVPYQDLHYPSPPANGGAVDWSTYSLSAADWQWIVGKDPETYDFTGIDPHMIEDFAPRQNPTFLVDAGTTPPDGDVGAHASLGLDDAGQDSGWDPINGREWITDGTGPNGPLHKWNGLNVDRQYACIFKLPTPRPCLVDANNPGGCECAASGLTHEQTSPACDEANPNLQTYAKAYPTTRELLVARDLGQVKGANAGIVSSICPVHTEHDDAGTDPFYGYRPAMAAIVQKLGVELVQQCMQPLQPDSTGEVPCLLLATLEPGKPESTCSTTTGLSVPNAAILARFETTTKLDPSTAVVCQVNQTPVPAGATCSGATSDAGWCYVTPDAGGGKGCAQEIVISDVLKNAPLQNASISYQCIQTYAADAGL